MTQLTLKVGIELGLDLFPVYQASTFFTNIPRFEEIYDNYKIEILRIQTKTTKEEIERQIDYINSHIDLDFNMFKGTAEPIETASEAEVFNFLLSNNYSCRFKESVYNSPVTEVW